MSKHPPETVAHRHSDKGLARCNRCDVILLGRRCVWCEGNEAPIKSNCPLIAKYPVHFDGSAS